MPRQFDLSDPELGHLLRWEQDGVVSRRQLLDLGATPHDIARMVRRNELRRVHPGVYVDHTGRLTREQREWVAVLAAWPAALGRESALPEPPTHVVHVAVALGRRVNVPDRVIVHRTADLDRRAEWQRCPPRIRLEHALIDTMSARLAPTMCRARSRPSPAPPTPGGRGRRRSSPSSRPGAGSRAPCHDPGARHRPA